MPHRLEHVAIVMDGAGRWAEARGLSRRDGHERGFQIAREIAAEAASLGVSHLTLHVSSLASEDRPRDEVRWLMELCADFVRSLTPVCVEHDVRFGAIGELDELFTPTRHAIETLVEASAKRAGLKLTLGIAYASRRDLAQAARELATLARAGVLMLEEIDEQALHRAMSTKDLPPVDLLITTGSGERLSDFLLFECARADVRFLPELWPDFDCEKLRALVASAVTARASA
ncbi:MAG: polyprenyl diphosphate synthase [Polyangiaceae bacterium]